MAYHARMRLGRKAVKTDARTLKLGNYLTSSLPPPLPSADWTKGITGWGMMLNDQLNDCTIAGCAHAIQVWTANTGAISTVPDSTIQAMYEKWGGYVSGNASTDKGVAELDILTDWRQQGLDGHSLTAFADPDFSNLTEIRQSIALFGGVYIGLSLPLTAQTQNVWDVVAGNSPNTAPNSWGGHCVFVPKYDQNGLTCISWGQLKTMTVAFWSKYCDEAHTLLGQDWLSAKGSPAGFNQAQLQADLSAIT
jgi:hypothetical protein